MSQRIASGTVETEYRVMFHDVPVESRTWPTRDAAEDRIIEGIEAGQPSVAYSVQRRVAVHTFTAWEEVE